MNVLALDLATCTGWALFENGREESGAETFDVKRGESPGMRYLRFNRWLEEVALDATARPRVELIAYEAILGRFAQGGAQAEIAAGFATHVQHFCARYGIEHHGRTYPATLKKWTTGRGNADKDAMLDAVARRWRRVDSHNEADAIALLHYTLEELVPQGAGAATALARRVQESSGSQAE